jgi:hypothetical protein
MNHHEHEVNGHRVNGNPVDEAELDAYEEQLTNEAVLDQVKVFSFLECSLISRHSLPHKKSEYLCIINSRGIFL